MTDTTTIGPQTTVQGSIEGQGSVDVLGHVQGTLTLSDVLNVAESGVVTGDVNVRQAIIDGRLEGNVVASELIVLTQTARVIANLTAPVIRVDDGALLRGQVDMDLEGQMPDVRAASTSTKRPTSSARSSSTRPSMTSRTTTSSASRRSTPATPAPAPRPKPPAPKPAPRPTAPTAATATSTTTTTTVVVVEEPAPAPEPAQPEPAEVSPAPEPIVEASQDVVIEEQPETPPEPSAAEANTSEFEDYTVKELRQELRRRDLPISGTKSELIVRLAEDTSKN